MPHVRQILKTISTKLGGLRLVRQYSKMKILWPAAKVLLCHLLDKQSYKLVYLDMGKEGCAYAREGVWASDVRHLHSMSKEKVSANRWRSLTILV